jgi:hypothetical protein
MTEQSLNAVYTVISVSVDRIHASYCLPWILKLCARRKARRWWIKCGWEAKDIPNPSAETYVKNFAAE